MVFWILDMGFKKGDRRRLSVNVFMPILLVTASIGMIMFSNPRSRIDVSGLISIPVIVYILWTYWRDSSAKSDDG